MYYLNYYIHNIRMEPLTTLFKYNCSDFHSSCFKLSADKFLKLITYSLKLYSVFHLANTLGFRYKAFKKNIKNSIKDLILKIIKSSISMTGCVVVFRASFCIISKILGKYNPLFSIIQYWICCIIPLNEPKDRVIGYGTFTFVKGLQGLFDMFFKLNIIKPIPNFIQLMFATFMSVSLLLSIDNSLKKENTFYFDFIIN